jgi:hypothetical protein
MSDDGPNRPPDRQRPVGEDGEGPAAVDAPLLVCRGDRPQAGRNIVEFPRSKRPHRPWLDGRPVGNGDNVVAFRLGTGKTSRR